MFFYAIKYCAIRPWVWANRLYYRDLDHTSKMIHEVYDYAPAFKRLYKQIRQNNILDEHDLSEDSVVVVVGGLTSVEWVNEIKQRYQCRFVVYPDTIESTRRFQFLYSRVDEVYVRPRPVETRLLVELIDLIEKDSIDLLRIDSAGKEYKLLPMLIKAGIHKRLYQILIQFNESYFLSHLRRYFITRSLQPTHRREWNYPFVCEKWVRKQATGGDNQ